MTSGAILFVNLGANGADVIPGVGHDCADGLQEFTEGFEV
jgi:hypothetical protein